jgi:hypothetical protein
MPAERESAFAFMLELFLLLKKVKESRIRCFFNIFADK